MRRCLLTIAIRGWLGTIWMRFRSASVLDDARSMSLFSSKARHLDFECGGRAAARSRQGFRR